MTSHRTNQRELVDLEECAKAGKTPPAAERYRIRIDKAHFVVDTPTMTGREILLLAEKTPPERFRLDQKLRGGQTKKIELDEVVDFRTPGIERFMTLPLDQTEGTEAVALQRQFHLPDADERHLDARGLDWEAIVEGGAKWLLLHGFPVPNGYTVRSVAIAIRIEASYPTAELNMAYFRPHLALESGRGIRQVQATATIGGEAYQRWSRHRTAQNPWRPGLDDVSTHLGLVEEWLRREVNDE